MVVLIRRCIRLFALNRFPERYKHDP